MAYSIEELTRAIDSGQFDGDRLDALVAMRDSMAPEEKSVSGFIDNVGESGLEYLKGFVETPIDLAKWGAEELAEVFGQEVDLGDNPTRDGITGLYDNENGEREALMGYFADRYGSVDGFTGALYNDPVGVLSDASMLAMPAAGLKNVARAATRGADNVVSDTFQKMSQITSKMDPLALGEVGAKTGINYLGDADKAVDLYTSVIKPSQSSKNRLGQLSTREGIITYMLDNGIEPTRKGVEQLEERLKVASKAADEIVESSNKTIPGEDLLGYYEDVVVNPRTDLDMNADELASVANSRYEKLDPIYGPESGFGPVSMQQLREMRRNADDRVNHNRVNQVAEANTNVLDRGQADHLRGLLSEQLEELRPINEQISGDLDALEYTTQAAKRAANNNGLSLSDILFTTAAGAGGSAGGLTGAVASGAGGLLLSKLATSPLPKIKRAKLYHAAKNEPLVMRDVSPYRQSLFDVTQFLNRPVEESLSEILEEEKSKNDKRPSEEEGLDFMERAIFGTNY